MHAENLTHPLKVSRLVRESVRERAHHFNIILDDVSITHLKFGPEFTHAVESKQIGNFASYFPLNIIHTHKKNANVSSPAGGTASRVRS